MKRFLAAAALATGLGLGSTTPAGAIIIIGGSEVVLGGPDTRVAVDATFDPCIAEGGILPCIAPVRVEVLVATDGRS